MILEPSFLAAGQKSKRNIKNLSFLVEQFLGTDYTDYTDSLCNYNRFAYISAINPCNPCLIYTLGKKLMTHPHLFVEFFFIGWCF